MPLHSLAAALLLSFQEPDLAANPLPAAAHSSAIGEILHNSGPVAFAVLILLLAASLFSWTIIFSKAASFSSARKQSARFLRAFRRAGRLSEIAAVAEQFKPSPLVPVFTEINDEYQRQSGGRGLPRNPVGLERAAATAASEALTGMEQRLTWLATIANISPFIGLFGTVMGIIDAFHGLGTAGAATLRAVAPGISEALITTAAGILVAIPAVIGYNQLTAQLRDFGSRMDDFGRELLNAIENAAAYVPPPTQQPEPATLAQERRRGV
ncbi:flagellar motor protein MotA [Granulicella sp. WH15]|uniref:MotA/TolQ/ExbB proton channel family protein n=1 Tax=Granulicella sp. WH15 TaxID=2602070 RepID=UPI0013679209|nr:MotA/TolQ/ExbB proton channel family protein [Granulicella sp. WH15]QHN03558.1 flagellar motor protein MotA [Granulicella sp. WH15]